MPQEWAHVETLIRELGSVRAAALGCRASAVAHAAIEQAISEATDAVVDTLNAPQDSRLLGRAQDAIQVAADVLAALDEELVRSLRMRARGVELAGRARELVEQARKRREA